MLDEQSMEELRMSLSRRHLPRARAALAPLGAPSFTSSLLGLRLEFERSSGSGS